MPKKSRNLKKLKKLKLNLNKLFITVGFKKATVAKYGDFTAGLIAKKAPFPRRYFKRI